MDLGGRDLAPTQFVVPEHILLYRLLDRIAKMKWFDRWFMKKFRWAWQHRHDDGIEPAVRSTASIEEDSHNLTDGVTIYLKQVIGGRLVSFRTYDRKTDDSTIRTYVITEDQNFELELGKIITLESMR